MKTTKDEAHKLAKLLIFNDEFVFYNPKDDHILIIEAMTSDFGIMRDIDDDYLLPGRKLQTILECFTASVCNYICIGKL